MLTGLMMKVLAFFLLNWFFSSLASEGSNQVLGKKLYSSLKCLARRVRLRAKLFFLLRAPIPGEALIR